MSATERLVARFMAATKDGPTEFIAYVIRDGLAINQHGREFAISATGCGWRVGTFARIDAAEAALLELAPLLDWARASAEEVREHRGAITEVLKKYGAMPPRTTDGVRGGA